MTDPKTEALEIARNHASDSVEYTFDRLCDLFPDHSERDIRQIAFEAVNQVELEIAETVKRIGEEA